MPEELRHYGVKGMRWGVTTRPGPRRSKTINSARARVGNSRQAYDSAKTSVKKLPRGDSRKLAKKVLREAKRNYRNDVYVANKRTIGESLAIKHVERYGMTASTKLYY